MSSNYWLMKAEPDSRIVKGKDVKVSVLMFGKMYMYMYVLAQFSVFSSELRCFVSLLLFMR